jgi:immune inhibitor A
MAIAAAGVWTPAAIAAPDHEKAQQGRSDDLPHPLAQKQRALRAKGLEMMLKGKATPTGKNKVVQVAKGQYVELARERTEKVFVVIVEFGDNRYPDARFADGLTNAQRYDGPLHNQIPQPDRSKDNTTLWKADYNKAHYADMYFNRMAKYYQTQSSGRYSVVGDVNGWVKVPFNQALYGRNYCGGIVCNTTKALVRDAMAVWVKGQLDAGSSMSQIQAYLREFDQWDRYDIDGDGNFDEPDGFIDHFQIVHAGGDEAAGDPIYGTDAIWSHRWYANLQNGGPGGLTGVNIGANAGIVSSALVPNNPTGVWVGDYTIQPENGGLGVFAHEYGHDLGLPDLYDTSGNTGGAENSTGFWTLMSSGANIGSSSPDGIGDAPTDLGVWEKLQLGWLNYEVAFAGAKSVHALGPAGSNTKQAQALFVVLPDRLVQSTIVNPYVGSYAFWSGSADNLNNTMTKTGVSGASFTAKVWYRIETDWDYAFLEASANGGTTWAPVATNLSDDAGDQSGFNTSKTGITGSSGGWLDLTATLPAGTNAIRLRYQTDGAVQEAGFVIDNIMVGGVLLGSAESEEGWAFSGFKRTTGTESTPYFNAYVAENRGYRGYDKSLATAYNFGFLDVNGDWVETFPYQNGLLISYWNSQYTDNNVGDHPGEGLVLPVDANPEFGHTYDGHLLRPRILTFDSTFGLEATDAITVNKNSQPTTIQSKPAKPVFNDLLDYWFDCDGHACTGSHIGRYQPGWSSVKVPKTGTIIEVRSVSAQGDFMQVQVRPAK